MHLRSLRARIRAPTRKNPYMNQLRTLLALSLCAALTACSDGPRTLRLGLTEGQSTRYRYSYQQSVSQQVGDKQGSIEQTLTFEWVEDVSAVTEEVANVGVTFEVVKFQQVTHAGSQSFDSTDPETVPSWGTKGYAGLVGRGFETRVAPDGEVKEVRGCAVLASDILREHYGGESQADENYGASFARQFSDEAMRDMLRPVREIYPDRQVSVGDSWTRELEVTTGFPRLHTMTFTLNEIRDGRWFVGMTSVVTPLEDAPPTIYGSFQMTVRLSGSEEGEFEVSAADGQLLTAKVSHDLKGSSVVQGGESSGAGMPMEFKGTITIRQMP